MTDKMTVQDLINALGNFNPNAIVKVARDFTQPDTFLIGGVDLEFSDDDEVWIRSWKWTRENGHVVNG